MGSKEARPVLVKLREMRNNECLQCKSKEKLEFAHIRPTKIRGSGRGMDARARDIKKHPNDYILLCRKCHLLLDSMHKFLTTQKVLDDMYKFSTTSKKGGGGGSLEDPFVKRDKKIKKMYKGKKR